MSNAVPPVNPAGVEAPRSTRATTILVVGILSLICCQIIGPIAWYMGSQELKLIKSGVVSSLDEGTTKAGMILGIIASILFGLSMIWVIFLGGLSVLAALAEQSGW
jgi:hypothetical protein